MAIIHTAPASVKTTWVERTFLRATDGLVCRLRYFFEGDDHRVVAHFGDAAPDITSCYRIEDARAAWAVKQSIWLRMGLEVISPAPICGGADEAVECEPTKRTVTRQARRNPLHLGQPIGDDDVEMVTGCVG